MKVTLEFLQQREKEVFEELVNVRRCMSVFIKIQNKEIILTSYQNQMLDIIGKFDGFMVNKWKVLEVWCNEYGESMMTLIEAEIVLDSLINLGIIKITNGNIIYQEGAPHSIDTE